MKNRWKRQATINLWLGFIIGMTVMALALKL